MTLTADMVLPIFLTALISGTVGFIWGRVRGENYSDMSFKNLLKHKSDEIGVLSRKYYDLIYAVDSKFPDETRHDTARRYIRERENSMNSQIKTEDSSGVDEKFMQALKDGEHLKELGNDEEVRRALNIARQFKFKGEDDAPETPKG